MKVPYISLVIPAYNEETNIRLGALDKVLHFLSTQTYRWDVTIVDDGSSDQTPVLLDAFARENPLFRVIHNKHQGKAGTVITGMLAAQGTYVVFSDLDQATPLSELKKLIPWFSKGYDVVIGSRSANRMGAPALRVLMARGFMVLRSMILGLRGIVDTQCGFKAFKKEVARDIFSRLILYSNNSEVVGSMVTAGFDIEVLFIAKKLGYNIKEVPVEWHYVETRRVNPLKDSIDGFRDIIRIRVNEWRGVYK